MLINEMMFALGVRRCAAALLRLMIVVVTLSGVPELAAQESDSAGATTAGSARALRPGDIIRLQIYREPELSGDYVVDEQGVVVLPKIGPFRPSDGPLETLQERIVREYGRYLNHSSITVTLLRRVQVLGAVRNPGLFPVDATLTVGDVLALAGGATPQGDPRRLELIRDGQRVQVKITPDTPIASSPLRSGDQIYVPERSWISRNPGVLAAALSAVVTVSIALLR